MSKRLLFLTLFLSLILVFSIRGFSQTLDEDYDRRERAVDPFEDEDKLLREKKINEIINRIKRGDRTVLRLVVFDTFEAVHDELVRKGEAGSGTSGKYYDELGGRKALPSYIGGFDNQDPKVRLKCIGFLGDWVDEVGVDTSLIERAVDKRLATNIETRKEVRYGYRVLKMKIVRLRTIASLRPGLTFSAGQGGARARTNIKRVKNVLVRITPEEFLPLVFYEPRIRTIYLGHSGAVRIRSIVLDPGIVPESGDFEQEGGRAGRSVGLDIERICYVGVTEIGDQGEVAQWLLDAKRAGTIQQAAESGGFVGVGNQGGGAAAGGPIAKGATLDWNCVREVFKGLDNKSLFIREHSARIFLNYIRGWTGDNNYLGSVNARTRTINPALAKMAIQPYYVRLAQVAWDNVKWSEYYYNDRVTSAGNIASFIRSKHYMEYEKQGAAAGDEYVPARTTRYFTEHTKSYPEWGTELTGNYRNDVKEILRVLGLSWYVDAEYVLETVQGEVARSRVDTLFNDVDRVDRPRLPDRSDRLEGESDATSGPQR